MDLSIREVDMTASVKHEKRRKVSREALLIAVASSTAVEAGHSYRAIKKQLSDEKSRFKSLPLA